jgi:hypothetical protein
MAKYKIFGTTSKELTLPTTKPETSLDFVNSQCIDPSYTFTRNSSGTYVGDDGLIKTAAINEPRFEFDPVTGEFKGLLIEERKTKISSTIGFPLGPLSSTGSTAIISPDGTTSGITRITSPSFGSTSGLQQRSIDSSYFIHSVTANQYYTSSIYVYATGVTNSSRTATLGTIGGGCLDAAGGPVLNSCGYIDGSNVVSSNTSFSVVLPRNKWVRVFLNWRSTCTSISGRSAAQVRLLYFITNNQTNTNFINSVDNPVMYLWGMSVETSFSTSIVGSPTSFVYGSGVTRQPDQLVLNRTLNPQGAFYIESSTTGTSLVADNGSSVLVPPQGTKSALFYNTSRTLSMSSSTTPVEGNYNIPQNLNRVSLGFDRLNNTGYINGHLKKFMYYGSPVTEDNLRSLTGNTRSTFRFDIGEPIVIDGLVLLLDAGNPASYPGSGTTWSDLSGNGNNGTLVNGVGYNSDNGGSLVFDGVDDYVLTPVNIDANPNTVSAWFNASSTSGARGIVLTDNGGWDKGFEITNGVFNIHVGNNLSSTGVSALSNTWYFGTIIYTSISMSFYINGTNVWNGGAPGGTSGSTVEIGRANFPGGAGSRFFIGNIAQVSIYNRALTASEIQQNFNAIRSRYGI